MTYTKEELKKLRFSFRLSHDLRLQIAENMKLYGGSFVQALGECVIRADGENQNKLLDAFPNYFVEYHPDKWKSAKGGENR